MSALQQIKAPVSKEMERFEATFRQSMASRVALLDRIMHYIVKRKGKQMRPMFVFLSAKLTGEINDSTYRAASLIELLHTATLVHDDVVDDSYTRRGFFSLNALWKNKIAVLVGDYLLSRGLLLALDNKEHELLAIVSTAVREMSEGELLQIEKARRLDIKEDIYYQIIRQKTATLFAACCAAGVASNGTEEQVARMKEFGMLAGMAFQIKDDLFDYESSAKTGKPTGIDIKEQKLTLPLIYTLQNCSKSERRRIINTVKRFYDHPERINEVLTWVTTYGGIDYARKKMEEFRQQALDILYTFPENEARKSLALLVDYVIERNK
jgi:octaprenyl-diphosphate synthase